MMAIAFKTKKEAKAAVPFGPERIIETSFFGPEFKDGQHSVVVSTAPDRVRNSFARITVVNGVVVKVA
jgi:hypothetical protein